MAKGWVNFATVNKLEPTDPNLAKRYARKFDNIMRSMKTPSAFDLKKEAEEADVIKNQQKAFLMQGFKDKKLKSKRLIKQAQGNMKKEEK